MRVTLQRLDDAFHLLGRNEAGNETHFDIAVPQGGSGQAPGPMETVAMALGACSSIDVIAILNKQRQQIDDFDVEIDYERATDQMPAVFTKLHVHFLLTGTLDPQKVQRAVDLSLDKYCSVSKMLAKTATLIGSCTVNGTRYDNVYIS